MTRFPHLPSRRLPLVAMAVVSLWLSGCASQSGQQADADPAEAFTELGMAYLERGNLPRAMAALNRALERDPEDPEALQAMAIVYQRQGEREQADEMFRQAIAADPGSSRARNNYAAFLYEHGQTRRACEQLEIASRDTRYANRAQLFANLGQCRWELGEIEQARHSLERARSLDPRNPRSYFTLAALELEQGDPERARQQLEIFVGLAGMTPDARALAQQIADRTTNMTVTPGADTQRDAP
ncbi:type IV pilus biogenesis/stability protein PilW [Halomonas sp. MCCC 1A17488]|uniref:Type IV pilus biogenesis/stability protein PilW n=1 Tax=Billgrantia sulfidoxydans TaxID=2733484 RepID=A0ABX7W7J7_9GAMM|nr:MULTISPECIES: type IV pilus biogenesis/stability protein PilW [Halomonas]MCE8017825.1 type IV pilus biogenesis/stability protein PilW [Halomonas sp. MCCC 1A17488]MCG3241158.1 type IV pilus biogenesis/stability protein PilW [Halomonas sp. MCCC 1A17488]QPP49012.1 type IV pilus biogenesis/stability protein PilW [Halomonas sp. SS10-MC5]QTP56349.1 type IV pilus biogenesis/stability protein PilW [Halomonas sulfidoxydans]